MKCGKSATNGAQDLQQITCKEAGCLGCEWAHWKVIEGSKRYGCNEHVVKHGIIYRLQNYDNTLLNVG